MMTELIRQQELLRQSEQKYGASHPDVVQQQRAVSALESGFLKALTPGGSEGSPMKPDNPAYVALAAQKESAEASLQREQAKLARYEAKQDEYENRLIESPVVQSQYDAMQRELQGNVNKYNDLKNKQLQARLAEELESGDGGEKFSMASPAYLPRLPDSPNRVGILLLGMLLAAIGGIVVVALAEYMDKAVYDAKTITQIFGAPPLVVIPRIQHQR